MICHIVFWKFSDFADNRSKEENMDIVKEKLTALLPIIPQIRSFRIGKDVLHSDMSYDMALIMEFDSLTDLDLYKNHPEHKKVSNFVKTVRSDRASVDFEF